jgi:hypothetical protein
MDAAKAAELPSKDARIAAARKVRDQFPDDYFAHRFYQDELRGPAVYSADVREEYRRLAEAQPQSVLYAELYARVLMGADTPAAIKLLDGILEKEPENVQAQRKLVEIYSAPAFRDEAKMAANAASVVKRCPDSVSVYRYLIRVGDTEFLRQAAGRLRGAIEARTDDEALEQYGTLWTMEFKTVPLAEQEALRERVRADVAKLRSQDWQKNTALLGVLSQGYKILGDAEGVKWADAGIAKRAGQASGAESMLAIAEWRRGHPYKSGFDRDAYQEALLKQTGEWIRQWPDDPRHAGWASGRDGEGGRGLGAGLRSA